MWNRILRDRDLAVILSDLDHELAEAVRAKGCPHCGGKLHSARYPRRPRCNEPLPADWWKRLSFCCDREGCRRRTTPPSVRFLGRRLYPTIVIVLVSALSSGLTAKRWRTLKNALGVDRRTVERWLAWWREVFTASPFWKRVCTRFVPGPGLRANPVKFLLRAFGIATSTREAIVALLRFLSPLSI
jgi:hypothetical protein